MGITDKIGSTFKKADSKLGEGYDVGKYKLKISDERSMINKHYSTIGEEYYKLKTNRGGDQAVIDKAVADIDVCNQRINEYTEMIEKTKADGKEERASM